MARRAVLPLVLVAQQAESHYARGLALGAMGRDSAAIAAFDEALARRPELVYPLAARAAAHDRLGDYTRLQGRRVRRVVLLS